MSLFFDQIATHTRVQFLRHIKSPAIWWLALAAPIGARFLVPDETASYSVLAVNNATLALDSGVIGLQLGVIMAIILTPIAYIFLRAGPTRKMPWQAENVTPAGRSALGLGHWIADTLALWVLMLALAVAGIMLAYFRLSFGEVNPVKTIVALCLIAAPALAVTSALRTIFSMRPWLRKAGGDVLFFFSWLFFITLSAAFFADEGGNGSPYFDIFGFAAPLAGATDFNIKQLAIIGSLASGEVIEIDAMKGVTDRGFLISRLFWVFASGLLVFLSGFVFKASSKKWVISPLKLNTDSVSFSKQVVAPISPEVNSVNSQFLSEWHQLLKPYWFVVLLGVVAMAGAIFPFRGLIGPALALLMIFPFTQHGARWRGREMSRLTDLAPTSAISQFLKRLSACIVLSSALCLPSFVRLMVTGNFGQSVDIAAIAIGLPTLAIGLGHFTRGPVAGRLALLILWYVYLNLGPSPLG